MRIDRGLERVRLSLGRRGVVSTASAIGLAVASQSAGAAPIGLVSTITAACVAAPATGGVILLMSATVLKYTMIAAVLAGATGVVLQHNEIRRLRSENVRLAAAATPKPAPEAALRASNAEADRLRAEVVRLKASPAASWQERAELLRDLLARLPEQNIPEISLATEDDWLTAVRGKLETADDYRRAFAVLRDICVERFSGMLYAALRKFVAANPGQFPTNVSDLESYMNQKVAPGIWARYTVAPAAAVANVGVGDMIIIPVSVIDPTFERDHAVGSKGRGSSSAGSGVLMSLERAYFNANGKWTSEPSQLMPFATTDREKAAVRAATERRQIEFTRESAGE